MSKKSEQTALILSLKSLLTDNSTLGTQEALCNKLQDEGYSLTQSSLSRLLRKLGVIKVVNAQGESIYQLPIALSQANGYPSAKELITSVTHNEALIVLRTSPGSASLIAGWLDNKESNEIIGTIAGDDTVLVIPKSTQTIDETLLTIQRLLHLKIT